MKKYLTKQLVTAVLIFVTSIPLSAQDKSADFSKYINLTGGLSFNGTGDNIGPIVGFEYGSKKLNRNWIWSAGFGATIHSDTGIPLVFQYQGNTIDGTVRETNAGIQVFTHIGYLLINNSNHLFSFKAGGLLRYQSNSATYGVYTLFPALTGLDYPVYVFENKYPQITFSAGLSAQFSYTYTLSSKLGLGIVGGFQFDINGDNISQLSLSITRFLK